jgi:catechol 2,3-dioxygenase-like lactoylglutathione lyase family enzyme
MLADADLVAFVATRDLERAEGFYAGVLGLPVLERSPIAVVVAAGGIPVRVTLVEDLTAAAFTVLGWSVPDVHAAVRDLTARGVTVERFDGMGQADDGVWAAPSGDQVAWFKDPDGNTLSLTEAARRG